MVLLRQHRLILPVQPREPRPQLLRGDDAAGAVKGGAILCHGAEQRRTTGRSVFSMSVTLRWASAEGLSGIERGAV